MKFLRLFLLALACVGVSQAQETAADVAPPDVSVLKLSWKRTTSQPNGQLFGDPNRTAKISSFPTAEPRAGGPAPNPLFSSDTRTGLSLPTVSGDNFKAYLYSLKIRNEGTRTITGLAWDYVLIDPGTGRELGRQPFIGYPKVGPGKNATLRVKSISPPSTLVTVKGLLKNKRSPFDERAEFRCVLYSDGTIWKSVRAKEGDCETLKARLSMKNKGAFIRK